MHLSKDRFEQSLNSTFWLRDAQGERAAIDLVGVHDGHAAAPYESFSLVFRGDSHRIHEQRTYAIEHDTMGAFDLFLVPVERTPQGILYEAIFNRIKDVESQAA